ncbi:hypothetical protein E2C01_034555 [Portunus trituberculatus]|uniref:Uncharacterized protein n=1 Tax=Portunus trituberculatus TaxID=210409 RepID=A0A5B7F623_PORTR|nr:hypothetical protein [Portunus trituberculatus]
MARLGGMCTSTQSFLSGRFAVAKVTVKNPAQIHFWKNNLFMRTSSLASVQRQRFSTTQSHEPSAQPSSHRSLIRLQSKSGFCSFLLTSLCASQNHWERPLRESTLGVLVFSLRRKGANSLD